MKLADYVAMTPEELAAHAGRLEKEWADLAQETMDRKRELAGLDDKCSRKWGEWVFVAGLARHAAEEKGGAR